MPGWSLNYEMFFYLIFALLLAITRNIAGMIVLIFISLVALGYSVEYKNALFVTYTNPLLLEFAAGVVIGKAYTGGPLKRISGHAGIIFMLTGVLILVGLGLTPLGGTGFLRLFFYCARRSCY